MPRYLPKRGRTQEPEPDDVPDATWAPSPPPVRVRGALRVVRHFNCEGFAFRQGDVVNLDDELVQRIVAAYPVLFEITAIPEG